MLVLLPITAAIMPMTAWARHPQMRQLRAYKMRITPASPMRCQGSRRIQPVDATHWLNISAGVWKQSVLRGLSFNCRAIVLSRSCE